MGTLGLGPVESSGERLQLDRSVSDKRLSGSETANIDNTYSTYSPSKVHIRGAKKHPAKLVESAAMAVVEPPDATYAPNLPEEIVTKGILSDAQLESVVYAGQALPSP